MKSVNAIIDSFDEPMNIHEIDHDDTLKQMSLRVISDITELQSLCEEWNALASASSATIYQTNQWAECWWKHFGHRQGQTLHCLVAYHDGAVAGIIPLYSEQISFLGFATRTRMGFIGEGNAYQISSGIFFDNGPSDYLDIIVRPGFEMPVCQLFMNHLLALTPSVDSIELVNVPEKSILKTILLPKLRQERIVCKEQQADICPYLRLPASVEAYFQSVSASVRRRLSQAQRAATEDSFYTIKKSTTLQEFEDALNQIITLHQRRWNRAGYPGLFADKRFTAFQYDILRSFFENGWLWCTTATSDDSCIAARLAFQFGNRMYDYLSGFDDSAAAAKRRPGLALLLSMIQDGIAEGYSSVDFLRGDEQYKFELTATSQHNWNLTINLAPQRSNSFFSKLLDKTRLGVFLANREFVLFGVQLRQHGFPKSLLHYIQFRTPRFRRKIASIFFKQTDRNSITTEL